MEKKTNDIQKIKEEIDIKMNQLQQGHKLYENLMNRIDECKEMKI